MNRGSDNLNFFTNEFVIGIFVVIFVVIIIDLYTKEKPKTD